MGQISKQEAVLAMTKISSNPSRPEPAGTGLRLLFGWNLLGTLNFSFSSSPGRVLPRTRLCWHAGNDGPTESGRLMRPQQSLLSVRAASQPESQGRDYDLAKIPASGVAMVGSLPSPNFSWGEPSTRLKPSHHFPGLPSDQSITNSCHHWIRYLFRLKDFI